MFKEARWVNALDCCGRAGVRSDLRGLTLNICSRLCHLIQRGAPYNHQTLHQALGGSLLILSSGQRLRWLEDVLLFQTERVCGGLGKGIPRVTTRSEIPHTEGSEISQVSPVALRGQRTHSHLQRRPAGASLSRHVYLFRA